MTSASPPRPVVVAHRGASGYRPEHTRAAFELAIALGADALEPDLVATRDGVLVIRHENELSGTTDVASRPEFRGRRRVRVVDGVRRSGWFTEDFTWAEIATLRARERLPAVRRNNARFDGTQGVLRLIDLLELIDAQSRVVGLMAEIKLPTHFDQSGLPLDELFAATIADSGWTHDARLSAESFELTVLEKLRARRTGARLMYLLEDIGSPADRPHQTYRTWLTPEGMAGLVGVVDGISVDTRLLFGTDQGGASTANGIVARAHSLGLHVLAWTCRAENRFLRPENRLGVSSRDYGNWRREFGELLETGVDGIFCDQPDLGVIVRDQFVACPRN